MILKILYVDICLEGHHLTYLASLAKNSDDNIVLIPDNSELLNLSVKQYNFEDGMYKNFSGYVRL